MTRKAVGYIHGTGTYPSPSLLTNPQPGDVIADTGPLGDGSYLLALHGFCDAAFEYDIQLRDPTNTSTVTFIRRKPAAGNIDDLPGVKFTDLPTNSRFRAVCVIAPGGGFQVCVTIGSQEMG